MNKLSNEVQKKIDTFSFDNFVEIGRKRLQLISLIMRIEEHEGFAYLFADDETIAYKVPMDAVRILSEAYSAIRNSGEARTYYRVEIDRSAPCVRMQSGSAGDLLNGLDQFAPSVSILTIQASISFNANGEGSLSYGSRRAPCLGKPGLKYPTDITVENIEGVQYQGDYKNAYKFRKWISSEFNNAEMPWAVKIWGQRGIFVHEGASNLADNGGPSQGCIHLASPNAKDFYDWITERTRIQVSYPW